MKIREGNSSYGTVILLMDGTKVRRGNSSYGFSTIPPVQSGAIYKDVPWGARWVCTVRGALACTNFTSQPPNPV